MAPMLLKAQDKTEKWGVFELVLKGSDTGNPFLNTQLSAEFKHGDKIYRPDGFYDGDGIYKIRFMPDEEGTWTYVTSSNQKQLDKKTGEFICTKAAPQSHGPVKVRNQYYFGYVDGTPFCPFGTTIYEWAFQNSAVKQQTIRSLIASPFNKVRMLAIPPYSTSYTQGPGKLTAFPFVGTAKENFDFSIRR